MARSKKPAPRPARGKAPSDSPSRAALDLSGRIRTLLQDRSGRQLARDLKVSESTVRRWKNAQTRQVKEPRVRRGISRSYEREVKAIRREARQDKVKLHKLGTFVPRVRRIQRPAYELLKQPIPGKPGKFYTKKTLPKVATGTVEYDVAKMDKGELMRLIAQIRDRGGKFRVVYRANIRAYGGEKKLKYKRRLDLRGKWIRTSTAPEDPEDWTDADILDYLDTNVYKTQFHQPLMVMENE